MSYRAMPCQCNWPTCKRWQVRGIAPEAKFDEVQARAVADLLNQMDHPATAQTAFTVHVMEEKS